MYMYVVYTIWKVFTALKRNLELERVEKGSRVVQHNHI